MTNLQWLEPGKECKALLVSDITPDHGVNYDTELSVRRDVNVEKGVCCDFVTIIQRDLSDIDELALTKAEAEALVRYLNSVIPSLKGL
ncbi:hypothetical protein [Serratia phage vB_SspM_LC53]|nr:hypothetical protein [Serratia phage vB_SspM_LC53]